MKIEMILKDLLENSYSPTYNYYVAAVLECNDGTLFKGVNVETTSPASGICAERNAIFSAIAHGYNKNDFKRLYIMNKTNIECFPCFVCRQAINDFCNQDMEIISYNYDGSKRQVVMVKDLCPYAFGENDLAN